MARDDFYASPFGVAYSAYMEKPQLNRLIAGVIWGGNTRHYYESMRAAGEVPAGGTIVDCPCGAGPVFSTLDPAASVRYVAADLSPSMLRRARKKAQARGLDKIEFIKAKATSLPMQPANADLFFSFWGLHCFDDPASALVEAARVLKPGGRLVGSAFVRGSNGLRARLLLRPNTTDFGPIGTESEVQEWLQAAGFASPKIQRSGPMLFFDARTV